MPELPMQLSTMEIRGLLSELAGEPAPLSPAASELWWRSGLRVASDAAELVAAAQGLPWETPEDLAAILEGLVGVQAILRRPLLRPFDARHPERDLFVTANQDQATLSFGDALNLVVRGGELTQARLLGTELRGGLVLAELRATCPSLITRAESVAGWLCDCLSALPLGTDVDLTGSQLSVYRDGTFITADGGEALINWARDPERPWPGLAALCQELADHLAG